MAMESATTLEMLVHKAAPQAQQSQRESLCSQVQANRDGEGGGGAAHPRSTLPGTHPESCGTSFFQAQLRNQALQTAIASCSTLAAAIPTAQGKKVNIRSLTDQASPGNPSPRAVPDDEELKMLAALAREGLASPPLQLDPKVPADKRAATWLLQWVHRAVGDLLLWRATPLGLLSELHQVASIAADPAMGSDAFMAAMNYSNAIRKLIHDHTRSSPLASDESFAQQLLDLEKVWHARSEDTLAGVTRSMSTKSRPAAGGAAQPPEETGRQTCLAHGMRQCLQKGCRGEKRSHVCPFCMGEQCGSRPGYLEYHLNALSRTIVQQGPQRGRPEARRFEQDKGRATAKEERRSPSRRRSRSRRRPQQAAPVG